MLLAVSGIVHATPSSSTLSDEISEPWLTRVLARSPLACAHGGDGTLPDVVTAFVAVARTRSAVPARKTRRERPPAGKSPRAMPIAAAARTHVTRAAAATKSGTFERSTAARMATGADSI